MTRPLLLDLFCGAGGAAMGYYRAGFDVVGVDIKPQPHYPFEFHQADALTFSLDGFDAIHASPPCQAYSALRTLTTTEYPRLVDPVRLWLIDAGVPYVIENVMGAPLREPVRLCGSSFELRVWRHRLFETSFRVPAHPTCDHLRVPEPIDVTGTGGRGSKPRMSGGGKSRKPLNLDDARDAMGIDWMSRRELSEAIPPAYTEWIGKRLIAFLDAGVTVASQSGGADHEDHP